MAAVAAVWLSCHAVAGIGDFDGDGRDDILVRNAHTSEYIYYAINGSRATEHPILRLSYRYAGVGDFDGDGRDNLLLRHPESGEFYYYQIEENTLWRIKATTNFEYRAVGVGDFDGDGRRDDLLLRHVHNGGWIYYVIDRHQARLRRVGITRNSAYGLAGIGDLDGDGRDEVVLRHVRVGNWVYYVIDGHRVTLRRVGMTRNPLYGPSGVGDLDGDGRHEVLLRHAATGAWISYTIHGSRAVLRRMDVPSAPDYLPAGLGDFDGDGRDGLLLRHAATGEWATHGFAGSVAPPERILDATSDWAWEPPGGMVAIPGVQDVQFVGVEQRRIAVSDTGTRWEVVLELDADTGRGSLSNVAYGNGLWVAVGENNLLTSTDGRTWTQRFPEGAYSNAHGYTFELRGVAFGDGRWNVGGGWRVRENLRGPSVPETLLTSIDGLTWSVAPLKRWQAIPIEDVAYGDGRWVAVGPTDIFESSDGQSWDTLPLRKLAWCGGLDLNAVAFGGGHWYMTKIRYRPGVLACARSADGLWTPFIEAGRHHASDIHYANGDWVAVGDHGIATWKTDSENWYWTELPTGCCANAVTHRNGRWVVGTSAGTYHNTADVKSASDWIRMMPWNQNSRELLRFEGIAGKP